MAFSGSRPIRLAVVLLLALLIFNGLLSYRAVRVLRQRRVQVSQVIESRTRLEQLLSLMKDAETGQRGYLYTGDETYLEPYYAALPAIAAVRTELSRRFIAGPGDMARLSSAVDLKLSELAATVELRRSSKVTQVRERVVAGSGKQAMDEVRTIVAKMKAEQDRSLAEATAKQQEADSYLVATLAFASGAAFMFVLLFAAALNREARRIRELQSAEKLATTGRMAATVAHEINNPLEAATNLIYLAATHQGTPHPVKDLLDLADRELARVAHMTKQTLGFYKSAFSEEAFSLGEMLDELVLLLDSKLQGKSLKVRKNYSDAPRVKANRGELFQVLTNIYSNAMDASYPGGVITLSIGEEKSGISIIIEDEGMGIPKELEANIFDAFVTTKKDVGTGLGLWVAEKLISKLGGRISVKSTSSGRKGSQFTVWLPGRVRPASTASGALPRTAGVVAEPGDGAV